MKQNGTTNLSLSLSLSMEMPVNLPSLPSIPWFFLLFLTIINQSFSARILGNPSPTHNHIRRSISFYMQDLHAQPSPSSPSPLTAKVFNNQIPFPKPLGFFPAAGGIPLPEYPNPNIPTQTLDLPGIGISFPARATLQELELGTISVIDEDLFKGEFGSVIVGRAQGMYAQGMYVASSEDESSHMMAMTISFVNGKYKDGLRLFGVHRRDDNESRVAVIGGTGKYKIANGYATIKIVNLSTNNVGKEKEGGYKVLKFDVFLG